MVRKTRLGAAAVVVVVVAAGAAFGATQLGLFGGGEDGIDQVPRGVDSVVHVDGDVTTDGPTRALLDELYDRSAAGPGTPANVDDALDAVENETGLDPRAVRSVVLYGKTPETSDLADAERYAGVVVHADWTEDEFVDAMAARDAVSFERRTEHGKRMSVSAEPTEDGTHTAVGVLAEGEYVVGTPAAVSDALAVEAGERGAFDGELRAAYDETRDGLVTYVARVPGDRVPEGAADAPVDVGPYRDLTMVSGAYYTTADAMGVETTLHSDTDENARDVADVTSGAISFASGGLTNETAKETLRSIEVERTDARVTVAYEANVDTVSALLDRYRERAAAPRA